jgi:RNA polymerase sigma-70 factor (ECF subfamily)
MRGHEQMASRATAVTSAPGGSAVFGEEHGAPQAVLLPDIEAILPNLRRYARSLTRDAVDADDLVQECVARALAKLNLWNPGTDLRAWLFSIMHNQYVSQVRRAAREGMMVEWSECAPALSCAPQQIARLELRELEQAIVSLPKEQQTAVLLVSLTPGNYDKIAMACGVPVGTIRSRLSRGRNTLRKLTAATRSQQHVSAGCGAPVAGEPQQ